MTEHRPCGTSNEPSRTITKTRRITYSFFTSVVAIASPRSAAVCLVSEIYDSHPRFMNQLSCGMEVVSLAGEWLTAAANTNMFTYEIAPVFILMEQVTMRHMREIIGYKQGDSILAPGGSISNLYAALVARHRMFPEYKKKGLRALPGELCMFTSLHSHYSMMGTAAAMGLGTDNCIEVPVDDKGRMIPSELDRLIQECKAKGKVPFLVCATAGTTVMGAFDPLHAIADVCEKHKLWFHVDAAWGGGVLLSKNHRHKMAGVERSDSLTWNPHKLMGVLLQCSTVHFKEDGLLISCNQMCADYLFQQDKPYDVNYDTGDKVIQCGRHNDIFKLWLMWRSKDGGHLSEIVTRAHTLIPNVVISNGINILMELFSLLSLNY
ncbi:glutamate decarboxylase-like [Penaeus indicus]|uniref:glutamate decarboxylase-like n=1 Tax=Penaeus indicus TaxID=29960 RepID=UPI00300D4345